MSVLMVAPPAAHVLVPLLAIVLLATSCFAQAEAKPTATPIPAVSKLDLIASQTSTTSNSLASTAIDRFVRSLPRDEIDATVAARTESARDLLWHDPIRTAALRPVIVEGELPSLSRGDESHLVEAVQRRLATLGFRPGAPDGAFGYTLSSAILAFQKHEGLERTAKIDALVWDRLWNLRGRQVVASRGADPRVEVDLERQIAFLVLDGDVEIVNVSSGGGYAYNDSNGGTSWAVTPPGDFEVERRIDGIRVAKLGELYRPLYFNGGIAIHGSPSVPGYPASHGCVRVSNTDMDYIFERIPDGADVTVHKTMEPPEPVV